MEYVNELDTISAGAAKDAALKVHRLTFMEATMMVVGVYHWFRCFRFSFCQSQCRLAGPAYVACRSRLFFLSFPCST